MVATTSDSYIAVNFNQLCHNYYSAYMHVWLIFMGQNWKNQVAITLVKWCWTTNLGIHTEIQENKHTDMHT